MLQKHPLRVPIIVLRSEKSKLPDIKQAKYLTPSELTGWVHHAFSRPLIDSVGQFLLAIRKRVNLLPTQTIFLFAEKTDGTKVTHCLAPTR